MRARQARANCSAVRSRRFSRRAASDALMRFRFIAFPIPQ
ncbi:Uncharacterised protein [Bordetella pertussis]|nr:Uncharacterised protein [Bordetella pertussis]